MSARFRASMFAFNEELPKGDHRDGGEERLQALSVCDSTEIDYPESGPPGGASDEVIHNVAIGIAKPHSSVTMVPHSTHSHMHTA